MVRRLSPGEYSAYAVQSGARGTDAVYEVKFEKNATRLLKHATITLPYTDAEVAGMNAENLRLYVWKGKWLNMRSWANLRVTFFPLSPMSCVLPWQ